MRVRKFIYNRGSAIRIIGDINYEQALMFAGQLDEAIRRRAKKLTVIINSNGGSLECGFAIYDALRNCGLRVITVAEGVAASCGLFIFMAGDRRYITQNSCLFIHNPSMNISGDNYDRKDFQRILRELAQIERRILSLLHEKTGKEIKTLRRDSDKRKNFCAEEAVAYGLAHEIV